MNKKDTAIIMGSPIIVGSIAIVLVNRIKFVITMEVGYDLIEMMIGVLGTILGFVITAVSILLTLGNNKFIELLIKSKHIQNIILSYVMASIYLLIALVFGIVILFSQSWGKGIFIGFIGMNIVVVVSMAICVFFLFAIVLQMYKYSSDEE